MRIGIDSIKCDAYGACADICPDLIELDEWGYAGLRNSPEVPPEQERQARLAIAACPEEAIVEVTP